MCQNQRINQSGFRDVKICDVVLFIKKDGPLVSTCQYGMMHQLEGSEDDLIWKVVVKYRNHNESIDRFTTQKTSFI